MARPESANEETGVYAIIEDSGQQFKVTPGDLLRVDLRDPAPDSIQFQRVLLVADGKNVKVGTPLVEGARVLAKVEKPLVAGPKVRKFLYRRRKGLRRRRGHRQKYTEVRIAEILL